MRRKHNYSALLKYMHMLEDGYSINYIHINYGINKTHLAKLWHFYQIHREKALHPRKPIRTNRELKCKIVLDIKKNGLSLLQASAKYGVSASSLSVWLKSYKEGGIDAVAVKKQQKQSPDMGRPKKVQKPETELERLLRENKELKTEIALLKKVKALVEEREARLRAIGQGQSEN